MRTNVHYWIGLFLAVATGCTGSATSVSGGGVTGSGITLLVQLSPPDAQVAGGNIQVTVEALDADQNVAADFVGTVHLTSSDAQASLPEAYTFTLADSGVKNFDAGTVLKTAGSQTITVEGAAGEASGTATVVVKAAAAASLRAAGFAQGQAAGAQGNLVVGAYDVYGNVAESYTGSVALSTDNPNAVLPAAHVFNANDKGQHAFGVVFKKAGTWSLTAADGNASALTSTQTGVTVVPASPNALVIGGLPGTTAAGTAQSANVTVYDGYANIATNFTGTVHFNTNDTLATVPAAYTFVPSDAGVATFHSGFTFLTAATAQNLVVSIDANVRTTAQLAVTALQVSALLVVPSPNVTAGTAFDATVKATDRYGNVVPWTGTVHFDSTDDSAAYPIDYLFVTGDHGAHAFSGVLTLYAAGGQNVIVTDNANVLTPGTARVPVAPAALYALEFGPVRWVTANANFTTQLIATDPYGNAVTNFAGTFQVYGGNGNFATRTLSMNQNVGGVMPLSGVHFGAAGTMVLNANNTVNGITANANFRVSEAVAFGSAQAANVVLGQGNFNTSSPATCTSYDANNLRFPQGGIYVDDGGTVWLPDTDNFRVVGYNALPTANGQAPDFELGQPSLDNAGPHWPLAEVVNANTFTPFSVTGTGSGGLVVVDQAANRVLIWNTAPSSTTDADAVLGQQNFFSSPGGCTSSALFAPTDAVAIGGRLFVSDSLNNRVLIWGSIPTSGAGLSASWVLGQPNLATCTAGTDANRLSAPRGLWSNGKLLAVADSVNNRVLVWNDVSTLAADGVPANVVLGQSSMTTATVGAALTGMNQPWGVSGNGTSLFVTDSGANRVLVFASVPTQSGATATTAFGQATTGLPGCGVSVSSAQTLDAPYGIALSGKTLIVGSYNESRYLLYRSN